MNLKHNKPGSAQYSTRLVSHAHQSAGAPPTCQRVLFLLSTLSCPAEFGAPLIRTNGAPHPQGPRLYECLYLLGEDFMRIWLLIGRGHPWLPGWGASPEGVMKQLMNRGMKENKCIKMIATVTKRDAKEHFLQLANCCTNCLRNVLCLLCLYNDLK